MLKPAINIEKIKPYKAGMSIEEVKRKYNLKSLIKLASNENSFGPSPKAIKALKEYTKNTHIYPDGACLSLKNKIAEKFDIKTENIIVSNGSNEVIELLCRTFLGIGDKVVSCYPTFSFYKISTSTTLAEYVEVPLKNYKFDLQGILDSIDNKTKLIIICNPNNPTGTILQNSEIADFIEKVPENILVAIDEAYIEFAGESKCNASIKLLKKYNHKNIIILRTFSKLYGLASLRIGFAISNEKIISYLDRVRQPFNVNGFAQIAALEALNDEEYSKFIVNEINKGKNYLYKEFQRLNIEYLNSYTNFIFFKTNFDNDVVFEKFLEKGVIIRSLKSFGYSKWLRVTIGKMEENKKFIEALESILHSG